MRSLFLSLLFLLSSTTLFAQNTATSDQEAIDVMLVAWHKAAADADFDAYFDKMTLDSAFLGTDATENWQNEAFKSFSKPYFNKGKAWSFTTLERNIYVDGDTAWFDEHLSTQMGICRGSGVVKKIEGIWKIKHYVLSIAVPNENVAALTAMKKEWDSLQMKKMLKH